MEAILESGGVEIPSQELEGSSDSVPSPASLSGSMGIIDMASPPPLVIREPPTSNPMHNIRGSQALARGEVGPETTTLPTRGVQITKGSPSSGPWDLLRAVILVQCLCRRKAVQVRIAKFKKRATVMQELAETENKYLVSLRLATSEYLFPLRKRADTPDEIVSADKLHVIFVGKAMEELVTLSKKMLVEFTNRTVRLTVFSQIGEVFLQFEDQMACYADYVVNYDAARNALRVALEDPKGVMAEFDRAVQKKHGIKLGIRDFLIMPVQRVPRYILLLRDILKHTPAEHPDHAGIVAATEMLTRFTVNMDMEAQRVESLRIVQSKLIGVDLKELLAASREPRLVHEGALKDERTGKTVYLFLLGDILLVAQDQQQDRKHSSRIKTLRGKPPPETTDQDAAKMVVVDQMHLTGSSRCTAIKSFETPPTFPLKIESTMFLCQNEEERHLWSAHIHRFINQARKDAALSKSRTIKRGDALVDLSTVTPAMSGRDAHDIHANVPSSPPATVLLAERTANKGSRKGSVTIREGRHSLLGSLKVVLQGRGTSSIDGGGSGDDSPFQRSGPVSLAVARSSSSNDNSPGGSRKGSDEPRVQPQKEPKAGGSEKSGNPRRSHQRTLSDSAHPYGGESPDLAAAVADIPVENHDQVPSPRSARMSRQTSFMTPSPPQSRKGPFDRGSSPRQSPRGSPRGNQTLNLEIPADAPSSFSPRPPSPTASPQLARLNTCPMCMTSFGTKSELVVHLEAAHSSIDNSKNNK